MGADASGRMTKVTRGTLVIDIERCKGCELCIPACPPNVLVMSKTFNAKGYHTPYMVHPEKCSDCDLCGMYCPDFAIFGYKEPDAAKATAPPANAPEAKEAADAR